MSARRDLRLGDAVTHSENREQFGWQGFSGAREADKLEEDGETDCPCHEALAIGGTIPLGLEGRFLLITDISLTALHVSQRK